ncbi:unnamed protein product [Cyclocybe aegerita]|uniref:PIH1 N-terminal domain-containing protein n=1 Tax=Cyclocybe aegerita TaxID=1973307 RepID=A0A8S0VR21_CYCAE|nr:unnamed protein product [Cyclocybe aegerita]
MQGEDVDETNPSGWYVPVIVSNGREDKDKAGNPSIVFDCIYHTSVKSRTLCDPEFKIFLVELALQRIEAQTGLSLSRNIATPNIASKGKLLPRTVQIPASLLHISGRGGTATSPSVPASSSSSRAGAGVGAGPGVISSTGASHSTLKSPLIQEIPASGPSNTRPSVSDPQANASAPAIAAPRKPKSGGSLPGLRGILKNAGAPTSNATPAKTPSTSSAAQASTPKPNSVPNQPASSLASKLTTTTSDDGGAAAPLDWSWTKDNTGRLRIEVRVPGLTHALIESSTLDVELRRFTLSVSPTSSFPRRTVDVDLALSDADILSRLPPSQSNTSRVLELKRERDFDVDGARAEWVVGSGVVNIWV